MSSKWDTYLERKQEARDLKANGDDRLLELYRGMVEAKNAIGRKGDQSKGGEPKSGQPGIKKRKRKRVVDKPDI